MQSQFKKGYIWAYPPLDGVYAQGGKIFSLATGQFKV